MKAQISLKVLDPDYDQAYADEYHQGQESVDNFRYVWIETYEVNEVLSVQYIDAGVYDLRLKKETGEQLRLPISNVSIFRFHLSGGQTEDFGVSKTLLNRHHEVKNHKSDTTRCHFYINPLPERVHIASRLILSLEECPKQLLEVAQLD